MLWLAFIFAKLSILLFYLKLSPYRRFRVSVYILIILVITYGLMSTFYFLFAYQPIEKFWDVTSWDEACIDLAKFWYSSAAINSASDFLLLALPAFLLWPALIPRWQKLGVLAIFIVGGL